MRTKMMTVFMAVAVGLLAGAAMRFADEEKLKVDQVPSKALDVIKKRFPGAEMTDASKEVKTFYEVTVKDKGQHIDVTVEDNEIVCIEKTIAAKDLPKAVAKTLEEKYPKANYKVIEEITKVEKSDERLCYYEVLMTTADGQTVEVLFNPDGKLIHVESKSKEDK